MKEERKAFKRRAREHSVEALVAGQDAVQMRLAMNSLLNRAGVVHEGLIDEEDDGEVQVVGITIHRNE